MPAINHEVKGTLAKLLATENLIIEHKKVPTACFDVQRRVLTLPIWDRASSVVYDLLVGHEVGHAIYTPNEDWTKIVNVPKDYVNVVEDARIEKLMKRKFPGLARTFYNGYSELNSDDFFGIADEDLNKLTLIDRINLHFKIGAYAQMPFDECEQQFVEMIEGAETFQQVLTICELIYKYMKEKQQEQPTTPTESNQGGKQGSGDSDGQAEQSMSAGDGDLTQPSGADSDGQDSSDETGSAGPTGGGPNESMDETVAKTQQNFDDQAKKLVSNYASETHYVERPKLNLDRMVVPCDKLTKYIRDHFDSNASVDTFDSFDSEYKKYRVESQKEVNYLVKEFEMKKSADAYQRMSTARTGTLDTGKLHTYKYSEDIFRKISVIPDGKNHGLIFILDWSGSMSDYLLDTVKQLFNLIWFCKKVQIPFEVYGFTYEWSSNYIDYSAANKQMYKRFDGSLAVHNRFALLNFVSSKVNNKTFDKAMLNLWRLASRFDRHSYYNTMGFSVPYGLDLSGTPLNESILALHEIIPDFQNKNRIQKVNVVILTDGEANHMSYDLDMKKRYGYDSSKLGCNGISNENALRDTKIGHVYRNFNCGSYKSGITGILLENLKDNFPEVNVIGFRILSGSSFSYMYRDYYNEMNKTIESPDIIMTQWRKEKTFEINGMGYDALYLIASNNLSAVATMNVAEDASDSDIGKAFRTMLKKKATNKKLLSSFATLVS